MLNYKKLLNKILAELKTESVAYNISKTSGNSNLDTSETSFMKCGNVITARLRFTNTGNVASGGNAFEGKLNTAELLPKVPIIGVGYYGALPFMFVINNLGTIQVRNVSPSAWNVSGAGLVLTATYLGGGSA